jgi:hypothetical protein
MESSSKICSWDEFEKETVQESIKRQVIDTLIKFSQTAIKEKISVEVYQK